MTILNLVLIVVCVGFSGLSFAHGDSEHRVGPNASISFEPGKAALTKSSEMKLKEMIQEAKKTGKIAEIQVAAWSDNPAPRVDENLSKIDRQLADQRATVVKNYLKRAYKVTEVDTYNMAERANWLARIFNTNEAEMKSDVAMKDEAVMTKEEFKVFKESGEPSHAVVQVLLKKAHQEAQKSY